MKRKATRGMTLVELLLTMGLLAIISVAVGAAMVSASRSYALTTRMQEDEYNARLAMLAISRDIHRGIITDEAGRTAEVNINVSGSQTELSFETVSGLITYTFDGVTLTRSGDSPVGFVPVELLGFTPAEKDGGLRIGLTVECTNGMILETIISIYRVPIAEE